MNIKKKYIFLALFIFGILIGMIADPIENAGGSKMHLVLAVIIAFILPLWIFLIRKIHKLFRHKTARRFRLNKYWVSWIFIGIFLGRFFSLRAGGILTGDAIFLALPFFAVFVGIILSCGFDAKPGSGSLH